MAATLINLLTKISRENQDEVRDESAIIFEERCSQNRHCLMLSPNNHLSRKTNRVSMVKTAKGLLQQSLDGVAISGGATAFRVGLKVSKTRSF